MATLFNVPVGEVTHHGDDVNVSRSHRVFYLVIVTR